MEHRFQPALYHRTFGSHEPVLHLGSGDRLITTTADALGQDATGERVTEPGNPLTGPFYIDGAEPRDTLAVSLERIEPNRDHGFTRSSIASNAVDPDYVPELPERTLVRWDVDTEGRTATLQIPGATPPQIELPLAPMLGCIGVAPDRGQAISTATSGPYGGNMDYRGFVTGVTAYLPVFVPGALLHVGDGHAVQGDGEIVGTGVEISMDVELTVNVISGKPIGWPRGETDEDIFTTGNARPLDQALQHATTEMLRWLLQDYGFDAAGANHLMGQAVRYEVGNVFDPAYTMVCKMPKRHLPPPTRTARPAAGT
ncbi:MAG: acetamidase/formamidase family protein [Dehalococcoidia bacterium]|jgi:acetamidase/formamidase|nr:acetamidase/formamidase family protein [Dehalococcoidia bacterium]